MVKILVLGATGGTGAAITEELIKRQIPVRVFGRSLSKLEQRWPHVEAATGDIFDQQAIVTASRGISLIVQCAAIPYSQTVTKQLLLAKTVLQAAKQMKIPVIFIDGIYAYGKNPGHPIKENDPYLPVSRKGKVKKALAELLNDPIYANIKPTLIHLPDYFGPTARKSSYLGATLIGIAQQKVTFYIGRKNVKREFIYLPDAAQMITNIILDPSTYGQSWNISGQLITGKQLINYAQKASGSKKIVFTMTKPLIRLTGLFDSNVREITEMYYLTADPVILDGNKYRQHFGNLVQTPFATSIDQTIKSLQK